VVAVATMPIFSLTRLGVLVGLWPLWLRGQAEAWRRRGGRAAAAAAECLAGFGMLPPSESAELGGAGAPAGGASPPAGGAAGSGRAAESGAPAGGGLATARPD
jgi:hypothetical protein